MASASLLDDSGLFWYVDGVNDGFFPSALETRTGAGAEPVTILPPEDYAEIEYDDGDEYDY